MTEIEYRALRETAGLMDYSWRGRVEITGADRVQFLHNILSNDIKKLAPGRGCYAALLNAQAKVLADMNVYVFTDKILLDVEEGVSQKLLALFEKFLITEDVSFRDISGGSSFLAAEGPKAAGLLETNFHVSNMDLFSHRPFDWDGVRGEMIKRSFTGPEGFHFFIPKSQEESLAKKLIGLGIKPASGAFETARIENGWLRYGIDMDESIALPETGLDEIAASETKGCYPGQEVVARTKTYKGLQRKIMRLLLEGDAVPSRAEKIYADGKEAGWVTSAARIPGRKIAGLGFISKEFFDSKTKIKAGDSTGYIQALFS